jgi:pimeloyl-ACP methyl ester carboxylesterase
MKHLHLWSVAAAAALLTACGGGGDNNSGGVPFIPGTTVSTGRLVEPQVPITTIQKAQIDAGTQSSGLQALSGAAKCDVSVIALNYSTLGANGEMTNASGVLLLPAGTCASDPAPLVAYAKGTDLQKPRTLANPTDPETQLLTAMYAAQGYAVVATDYLGYAQSQYPYHPYLHADSEARSVLDSIRAARAAIGNLNGNLSGKVMFTGYSQGGHSSMAAHRSAERDYPQEFDVVAGAHLAGPYNLSGATKLGVTPLAYQFFVPFQVTAYQKVYGDVYAKVGDAFKPPYDAYIENLLPSATLNATTLVTSGALPGANGETPAQVRDLMFQSAFLLDAQTNPANKLFLDAQKNDMFGWSPKAITLLCGGAGDPTVPPAVHQVPMKADFDARGVKTVTSVDVDAQIQATYGPGGAAPTDPSSPAYATYYGNYHGTYEPPFCLLAARTLFNTLK